MRPLIRLLAADALAGDSRCVSTSSVFAEFTHPKHPSVEIKISGTAQGLTELDFDTSIMENQADCQLSPAFFLLNPLHPHQCRWHLKASSESTENRQGTRRAIEESETHCPNGAFRAQPLQGVRKPPLRTPLNQLLEVD